LSSFFKLHDSHISDPQIIANNFNSYFVNIGSDLARNIPSTDTNFHQLLNNINSPPNSFFLSPTDSDEINLICKTLKSGASCGHDDVKPDIVKSVSDLISSPLAIIFNLSLSSGSVPKKLKCAKVVPIFKNGENDVFSNHRPISILPVFSKILERLIHKRLYKFVSCYNLLHENQFGFRPGLSTEMAILQVYNNIISALDSRKHTVGVFLDLSKAFDTINHDILLSKLAHYGIRGIALEWFRSYLNDRFQFVTYNSHKSPLLNISTGVPQGSILGPLLFILYINDLFYVCKHSSTTLFADDCNIVASHKNFDQLIEFVNHDLCNISTWFMANKLSLNIKKSNYMFFKNRFSNRTYDDIHITINDNNISRVSSTKFLGIILDECLTWNNHSIQIANLVSKYSGILYRLKQFLNCDVLFSLYQTLVIPHIMYCNLIWADRNNCTLDNIHRKQKRIIRFVYQFSFPCAVPTFICSFKYPYCL
jgi:retron-type reverse transcriptase